MRETSIRNFQRNFYQEIKDLPVTVTQHGDPLFVVTPYTDGPVETEKKDVFVPSHCEIDVINQSFRCLRPPDGQFFIRYIGDEPQTWTVWLCEGHAKIKGDDIEVRKV